MTTITATELARGLSDVLNRVRYRGESFVIERGGEPIAHLEPAAARHDFTMADAVALLKGLPRPDDRFADDLEAIQAEQDIAEMPPWPS